MKILGFWKQNETSQRLMKSFHQFRKLDWNKQSVSGYKPSEIQVLFCIKKGNVEQGMTVSEISKLLHVTSPTVTQIVNSLENNELVVKRINNEDRRSAHLFLTDDGEKITQQAAQKYTDSINGLIDYLGESQSEQLIELLDKVFVYYRDRKN